MKQKIPDAEQFDRGNPAYLAGMSGVELARAVVLKAYGKKELPEPTQSEDRSPEYWAGWALVYFLMKISMTLSFSSLWDSFSFPDAVLKAGDY